MQITINYMSQLKKAAGIGQETLTVEDASTVQRFLAEAVCPHRTRLCETIREQDGAFRGILLVFVGDEQIDLDTPVTLNDGDEVTIMFPIAGG